MTIDKTGILLINLGTPDAPTTQAVRHYLREFLSDPLVVDIPAPIRWLLLNAIILPFRSKRSAEAYQQIWTEQGSPLLVHSRQLVKCLQQQLGDSYAVELGMRYGKPSIETAIQNLAKQPCKQITIFPLYPQYALATTASSIKKVTEVLKQSLLFTGADSSLLIGAVSLPSTEVDSFDKGGVLAYDKKEIQASSKEDKKNNHTPRQPTITIHGDFYDHPSFIDASATVARDYLQDKNPDHYLLSYHGLPTRQVTKVGCDKQCDKLHACPAINDNNRRCYRAQCYATSRALAKALHLSPEQYTTSFQSRLGRAEWIKPYTDETLKRLAEKGIKKLAVLCPSFVADCLETLEEIGIRGREQWQAAGGSELYLVPCVNTHDHWVSNLTSYITKNNQ